MMYSSWNQSNKNERGVYMFSVGIDVSKGKSTIAIINNGEIIVKPFTIEHSEEGIKELLDKLKGIKKQNIKFVMEATGVYHLPILTKLLELKFFVTVENPFLLKNILMFH